MISEMQCRKPVTFRVQSAVDRMKCMVRIIEIRYKHRTGMVDEQTIILTRSTFRMLRVILPRMNV
ncbi:hypothetical protein CY34DRAFT_173830 [Suillus luteus UH-Slu-Lm8-n1]|uniref:Uncharacterized protein n=1 Tax=Suillus luteus UH-Slu-Lm8-n1 TaxID=930992 RepID=A0A0D0AW03_9AGAM|nr:hypothetical protein CY34DRAFT_173830 [Suillus luteus UH-Slu-Lm8-n1]